jgi:hypothetical protein
MKARLPERLEQCRTIQYVGRDGGLNGRFIVQGPYGCELQVISDDGGESGWEQVSVSTDRRRSPNWPEMCFVKDLFWDEEERVMQLHPPLSEYVKNHPNCLHLWKPRHQEIPAPPVGLVGIVGLGPNEAQALINDALDKLASEYLASAN